MKGKVQFVIPCWIGDLTPKEQTKRLIEDILRYERELKKELGELEKYKTKLALAIMGVEL